MYFESKKDAKKEAFYKAMNGATAVAVVGLVQGIEQVKDLGYDKHSKSIVKQYKARAEQAIVALAGVSRAGEDERQQAIETAYKLWEMSLEQPKDESENA